MDVLIAPDTRDRIIEILRTFKSENAEKYGIESMSLFGSVARNEHNENSDVDLLIKFKSPSPYLYAELADALRLSLEGRWISSRRVLGSVRGFTKKSQRT